MNDTPDYTDEEKALLSKPLLRAAKEIRDIELLRAALAESDGALFKATGEIIAVTNERDVWARRAETAESDNSRLRGKVDASERLIAEFARQHLIEELDDDAIENADWDGAYQHMIKTARAFLAEKETTK